VYLSLSMCVYYCDACSWRACYIPHVSLRWSSVFLPLLRLSRPISPSVSPSVCLLVRLFIRPSGDDESNLADKCNYSPLQYGIKQSCATNSTRTRPRLLVLLLLLVALPWQRVSSRQLEYSPSSIALTVSRSDAVG